MTRPTRKPWVDGAPVEAYAFARIVGPSVGPGGCGVGHYAAHLAAPVSDAHRDSVGRVSARSLHRGAEVRHPSPLYALALAFGLHAREDYAGGCVAELVDVQPAAQWPRPEPSGLPEAWARLPVPGALATVERAARITGGVVRLDSLAADHLSRAAVCEVGSVPGPADIVRAIADALDTVRPGLVVLGGVTLVECSEGDSEPTAYRWPDGFTGWAHIRRGSVEDCTTLAALAVGVALRSCLPTADEVAAWMDEDEPQAAVEAG